MHKFFVKTDNIINDNIFIEGEDYQHATKVLRLKTGDKIQICDGEKNEYICLIQEINKKQIKCEIIEHFINNNESNLNITLFQGLPKAQKMELIIQKGVEIGIKEFQPILTERVVVKTEGRDLKNKLDRWNRISYEAAKQSNRGIVPRVNDVLDFEEAINKLNEFDVVFVPYEKEKNKGFKKTLKEINDVKSVAIIIGPEGGFSEQEIDIFIKNNYIP
ncbi:MAG: 16S rRNA (uracil(1498)-N(3))-methyltransferase, partial [Clostridiales bacterium]|nr:16S rRNA (uracil(1498)-N(3))-methyltransferase [Clostridiales bacterium]